MRTATRDDNLLESLLDRPAQVAPPRKLQPETSAAVSTPAAWAPPVRETPQKQTSRQPRPAPAMLGDLYSRLGRSMALCGFLALSSLLWYAGAFFTLSFLEHWYSVSRLGLFQWLIPMAITTIEVFLWPRWSGFPAQWLGFLSVLLFDVGTTVSGLMPLIAGRAVDLFGGFSLPVAGLSLYTLSIAGGLLLAYGPEKLGKWALSELYSLWR